MKYQVIAHGEFAYGEMIIIANRKRILGISEIVDSDGNKVTDIQDGSIISKKDMHGCDIYLEFTKKEWKKINDLFKKVKV